MKKVSEKYALDKAYHNLYNCKLKMIDKHLDTLIKAKKFYAQYRIKNIEKGERQE